MGLYCCGGQYTKATDTSKFELISIETTPLSGVNTNW